MTPAIILATGLLLLRVALAVRLELFFDESLYAWLGITDPLGLCPHPPATLLLARWGIGLFGKTELAVRIGSLLAATLTPIPLYLLARAIGGSRRVAAACVLVFLCLPFHFGSGIVLTPDALLALAWMVSLWLAYMALERGGARWWIACGCVAGAGVFIKYMMVLFFPALALLLLASGHYRPLLRRPGPYLLLAASFATAGGVALACDIESALHAVRYHLSDRQSLCVPNPKDILEYHALHAAYLSPLIYPASVAAMIWAAWTGWRAADRRLLFLAAFSLVPWFFFLSITTVTSRQLCREQWDAPAYLAAIVAMVMMWERVVAGASSPGRAAMLSRFARAAVGLGLVIIVFTTAEVFTGVLSRITGRRPIMRALCGWRDLARGIDEQLRLMPRDRGQLLLAKSQSEALLYWFYGSGTDRIYTLDHPSAFEYGTTDLLRKHGLLQEFLKNEMGNNAVFAMEVGLGDGRLGNADQRRRLKVTGMFETVEAGPQVETMRNGLTMRRTELMRCYGLRSLPGQAAETSATTSAAAPGNP